MTLETSFERLSLPLAETFTIVRGSVDTAESVVVRIEDEEFVGVGATTPSSYYGETVETVTSALPDLLDVVEIVDDPHAAQRIERRMDEVVPGELAAKCAVTTALADLAAKRLGVPLYRQWGLDPAAAPRTSYTVSIDDPASMAARASDLVDSGFSILKLKVGLDPEQDRRRVAAVREAVPEATIRVDANGGWDAETAIAASQWLDEYDVEFLEQPVPRTALGELGEIYEASAVPIAADESCVFDGDVPAVADRADVVVVKLSKCGGPWAARRQIHAARAHGLEIMLGCMVESNASIAAAMQLSPLATYADLDGSLLIADDPFDGVPLGDGRPALGMIGRDGTGAVRR